MLWKKWQKLRKMNKLYFLSFLYIFFGCGFSSGLYQDILTAQNLLEEQKFDKAAVLYEKILKRKPSKSIDIKISFQLGEIYSIYLERYDKSLYYFNKIISDSSSPLWEVKALEKVGYINFENLKNYKKSAEVYKRLINFRPILANIDTYKFKYAVSLFKKSKYDQSKIKFKEILLSNNQNLAKESIYYLALIDFYRHNWNDSIKNFKKYLVLESQKNKIVKTKFMIANAYESASKLKEAYNIYYSLIGEYPNPKVIRNRLNSLYKRRVSRKR